MKKAELIDTLNQIEKLPTLPVVAQQILKLISSRNSSMTQVAEVITRDQAIAARVIRLTNSAFYGLRSRITSIQHAIVILGLNTVKNLVLGVSVVKTFEDSARASVFNREQFWLHTFGTAMGAKLMAKHLQRPNDEDYFLAGLLHDIGILAIDQFLHQEFVEILKRSLKDNADFLTSEMDVLSMSHGGVGGFIAEKWNIPDFLIHTIKYHHTPVSFPSEVEASCDYISVVHVADAMSRKTGVGKFVENFHPLLNEKIFDALCIPQLNVEEIFEQVKQETKVLMKEWGL